MSGYNSESKPHAYGSVDPREGMRRRHIGDQGNGRLSNGSAGSLDGNSTKSLRRSHVVRQFDLFPKVERDLTVRTERGGLVSIIGFGVMMVLLLAEFTAWREENRSLREHVLVDKSLGQKMRVEMNITFPSLHCDDLHVDAMDVAGDSQLNVEETLFKRRLHRDGSLLSSQEIKVETNRAAEEDRQQKEIAEKGLPEDYCGPCYGAQDKDDQCCNTCDDVMQAYKLKSWNYHSVTGIAEQCKREGKTKVKPKLMSKGEGCNMSGYMTFSRVSGNFHIAMGEGVERDGRHIHKFQPEDAPNFNASHIIHSLSFGPDHKVFGENQRGRQSLEGVKKIITEDNGSTGMLQYFIKIVPTKYKGKGLDLETNRYFFTERFRPLMTDMIEKEHHDLGGSKNMAGAHVGGAIGGSMKHDEHHKVQNAVLPGVFFIYEIYPFKVEVKINFVPLTHLLIQVMATIGGIFTIVGWADSALYARDKKTRRG